MKLPNSRKPYKKLSFWAWLLGTLVITIAIVLLSLKTAKIEQRVYNLEQKEPVKVIEKQPIYNTKIVEGSPGIAGKNGADSVSTHTVIEKQTTIIQENAVQGEKGEPGKKVEFGSNSLGVVKYFRYEGDREWQQIPVVEVGDE